MSCRKLMTEFRAELWRAGLHLDCLFFFLFIREHLPSLTQILPLYVLEAIYCTVFIHCFNHCMCVKPIFWIKWKVWHFRKCVKHFLANFDTTLISTVKCMCGRYGAVSSWLTYQFLGCQASKYSQQVAFWLVVWFIIIYITYIIISIYWPISHKLFL